MSDNEQDTQVDPAVEREAKTLGWVPKDRFRGASETWVDAAEFVERGRTILPIVRQNNRVLNDRVQNLETRLAEANDVIESLKEIGVSVAKDRIAAAKRELAAELKQARTDEDTDAEVEIQSKIAELATVEKETKTVKTTPAATKPPLDPEFKAWLDDNPWFGKDKRKTGLAQGIVQELRSDHANDGLTGRAFYDRVSEEVDAAFGASKSAKGGDADPPADKVEGSRGGAGGSSSKGRKFDYAALPAAAKTQCDKDATKFVGEKKAFKDVAAWRAEYSRLYFADEA